MASGLTFIGSAKPRSGAVSGPIKTIAAAAAILALATATLFVVSARPRHAIRRLQRSGGMLLAAALPAIPQPVSKAIVVDYHPRILINRDLNAAEIKQRAPKSSPAELALLQKIASTDGLKWNFCNVNENPAMSMVYAIGFMYQMTGDARYADKLIDGYLLKCFDTGQGTSSDDPGFALEMAAISFDWTYSRILEREAREPGLKAQLVERLKRGYKAVADDENLFRERIREADFHNYTVEYANGYLMIGLALHGEDPMAPEMIQRGWGMIAEGYDFQPTAYRETFQFKLKASIDMTDGAMNWEGPLYWRAAAPEICRAIEAFDTATNRRYDVWHTTFANLINAAYYRIYMLRPDGTMPGLGDSDPGQKPSWKDNFALAILLNRFRDGHIRYFIDSVKAGWYGGYGAGNVFKLMYYDGSIKEKDFRDLPPSRQFGREIVLRSGWGPADTFLTFTAGSIGYYHNHLDENSFTVFRYGDLAADGGYSLAAPYYQNYFKRTVAHNTITVFDPSECWRDNSNACTLSNDGGQRWPLRRFSPPFKTHRFEINRLWSATVLSDPMYREQFVTAEKTFETRPEYDYIRSDATRAYTNQWSGQGDNTNRRVALAQRELVFVRPNFIFMLDRVVSTNPAFQKSWLLHSVESPKANIDGAWFNPPDGITDYLKTTRMEVEHGGGGMFVETLLPAHPRIRVIGGPGYEGWVNGQNYWAPKLDPKTNGPFGRWRFEVQPVEPKTDDLFLHFLYPTKETVAPAASLLESATAAGAAVEDKKGPSLVVVFAKDKGLQSSIGYRAAKPGKANHIVVDLAAGRYDIYRDGAKQESGIAASPQGSLLFSAGGPGEFAIVPAGTALPRR